MQKKLIVIVIIISMVFIGCATHVHNIGTGPEIGYRVTARQWYLFNVPLNSVDTNAMADSAANYEIQTQTGPVDIAISAVGFGIVTSRTVTVTK